MSNVSSNEAYVTLAPAPYGGEVAGVVVMGLDTNNNAQAVSNNNPFVIIDAYVAPVIATWNSSTAVNTAMTLNTQGMDSVAVTISVSGTVTAGSISFQVYDGANWVPIKCARESSYNTDSVYSMVGITGIQGWTIPAAAFPEVRILLSTALTGTSPQALVTAIVSSAPDVSVVTAGLDPQQALHPGAITLQAEQVVAVGASSVQSSAVQSTTNRVVLTSTTGCWVAFGSSPTASAAAGSIYLPPNVYSTPYVVTPSVTKIAVIQASSAGSLSIQESV